MSSYVGSVKRPPKTLTTEEQKKLLDVTGLHRDGFRDHMIFAFALGTGLREHEIAALTVGDVYESDGKIRERFPLRVFKRSSAPQRVDQEAILPKALRYKLAKFYRWKRANDESLEPGAALFVSRKGSAHLTTRGLRSLFATWQTRAGFERRFGFHHLRHTALTNLYRATKDPRLVQRVGRHHSLMSTMIYTHTTDEDVIRAVREQPC